MILSRYIIRECLTITLLVSVVLLAISMISQLNIYLLAVVNGSLEAKFLAPVLISFTPQYMSVVLPLAFFIATAITLSRLQNSNELIIMTTCGISRHKLALMLLPLAIVFFVVALITSLFVTPYSTRKAQEILSFQENRDSFDIVAPQTFISLNDNTELYTESLSEDKKTLNDIYLFIRPKIKEKPIQVIYASHAKKANEGSERHLLMGKGYQVQVVPGQANLVRTTFDSVAIRLPPKKKVVRVSRKDTLSNSELLASDKPEIYQLFFWRVSLALFVPILFIIAVYMFSAKARHDNSARNFMVLFFSCLGYIGANTTISSLANNNLVNPAIAYTSVHLIAIMIALLYHKANLRV